MLVEASKVINDPKCNKGPKCNFFGSLYAYGHKKISQRLLLALLQVPGGGVLPHMGYIGMCRCEGYSFQVVYSRIGYVNQSVWV